MIGTWFNPVPSVAVIEEALLWAENVAVACDVFEASANLREANRALFNGRVCKMKAARQTTMNEFFVRQQKRSMKHRMHGLRRRPCKLDFGRLGPLLEHDTSHNMSIGTPPAQGRHIGGHFLYCI